MKYICILILIVLTSFQQLSAQKYLISTYNGQTVNTCGGSFFDSGDSLGNYLNKETYSVTFCSLNGVLVIDFVTMSLAAGDVLTIYDGSSTLAPVIKTFTSSTAAAKVASSCGCLTIRFTSDKMFYSAGWKGVISCSTSNDYILNAKTLPLDNSCLTMQSNINSTPDFSSGCFISGNTVWYGFSTTQGNNTVTLSLQNASFIQAEYLLLADVLCTASGPTASVVGVACGAASSPVQFTGLTEGYYWLGVSSSVEGTFSICASESFIDECGDYFCGQTESCNNCPFDCGTCPEAIGGPYFHPTVGIQNTYLGICMVNTCNGKYYDNGGENNPYSNGINWVYRTFCPSEPYNAVEASFQLMDIEYIPLQHVCNDAMYILNGPTQNSEPLWGGCGNSMINDIVNATGNYGSGVFRSTHPSGCLTFRFNSDLDSNGYWEGWDADLACVPNSAGPDSTYNNDCPNNMALCDDRTISSQVRGPGTSSEGCGGCVTSENFTEWYRFKVLSGGIMELEITPLGNSDMDFALYRADSCGEIGMPVRCSYASYQPPGKTGLSILAGDISEGVSGDQWVAELKLSAGEQYFLMINEWDKREPNAYTIDFKLSGGASFDCSEVLPVSFLQFFAVVNEKSIDLIWKTASENSNAYFTIERSDNAADFFPIGNMDGAGNSNTLLQYVFTDSEPLTGMAYYRIRQTDFDGNFSFSNILAVDFNSKEDPWVKIYPNPSSDLVFVSCDPSLIDKEYTIYNAVGAETEIGIIPGTQFKLSTLDMYEGVYYLSVKGVSKQSFLVLHNGKL